LNGDGTWPSVRLLEQTAKHERLIVFAGLAAVAVAGLFSTLRLGDMLMMPTDWVGGPIVYPLLLFIMWWTMMMAMMLPSAAPAILTYAALRRKFTQSGKPAAAIGIFVAGYAAIWTGFSLAAVALHFYLAPYVNLSMMMAVTSAAIGGGLLIAAGLYQMTPLKAACLKKCQTPLFYFAHHWQNGTIGAFRMGLSHGLYCLGCCWVLMGLLFYGGVMELRWIVGLAIYVAIEKLIPLNSKLNRYTGLLLIAWGLWVAFQLTLVAVV